jgi:isopenicillin N synthase-like dioxygenase
MPLNGNAMPVIDITALRGTDAAGRQRTAAEIRQACMASGFFYVKGHAVAEAELGEIFAAAKRFFDLPLAEKEKLVTASKPIVRGYDGIGAQALDSATGPDRKESFFVAPDLPPGHPLLLSGTDNLGPHPWPATLAGWCEKVQAGFATLEGVAHTLLAGIALSLDLPADYFVACFQNQMSSLRLLHYPPHLDADPTRSVGCGAHTDWGALTVLAQDDTGGLEIQLPGGEWVQAAPIPGTLIVNIGDCMSRWTNDLYVSAPHRVLNRSPRDRYSAVFFFDPAYETVVECLPTCRSADNPPRYPPISSGEHLMTMYRKTYAAAE